MLSLHDLERAAALATRAVILARGRIAWSGPRPFEPAALAEQYERTVSAG